MNVLLSTLNAKFIHSSLALRYLKRYAAERSLVCHIEEYTINMPILDIVGRIMEKDWHIVGFACYIWNIEMTLHVAKMLKVIKPSLKIILGGPEVSFTAREILKSHSYIDYIVQGEGEEALTALLKVLTENAIMCEKSMDDEALVFKTEIDSLHIPGILSRRGDTIIGDEIVVEVKDLSTIPFPYTEEDMKELGHKIVYYETSRGCPFSCQYCLSGNRNTVRFFPLERCLEEIKWLLNHKVKQIKFVDRTFNCAKRHHLPLMEFMASAQTDTNFHLEMEADLMGDQEVEILTSSPKGQIQIEVGVQSTHKKTLDAIKRFNNWGQIKKVMIPIIEGGRTHVHMDLIVGLPFEDYERFKQSFNDVFSLGTHVLQIGFLKLLKGSGVRQMTEHEYIYDEMAPYEVLANKYLSYEQIRFLKIFEDVFERFYNSDKFSHTFNCIRMVLEKENHCAFTFFEELTKAWMDKRYHLVKLKDRDQALFLYNTLPVLWENLYFSEKYPPKILFELLKLDILWTFEGKLILEEMGFKENGSDKEKREASEAFWRKESIVRQYLPSYSFKEWAHVRRSYRELEICGKTLQILHHISKREAPKKRLKETIVVDIKHKGSFFVRPSIPIEKRCESERNESI